MSDDPRQILAKAGVECAEVEQLGKAIDLVNGFGPADDFAAEMQVASMLTHINGLRQDAILALARLVAKYKWQRDESAQIIVSVYDGEWGLNQPWDEEVAIHIAELERLYQEKEKP